MNFKQFLESTNDLRSMIIEFMNNYPSEEMIPYIADWFEDHGDNRTSEFIRAVAIDKSIDGFIKFRHEIRKKINPKVTSFIVIVITYVILIKS